MGGTIDEKRLSLAYLDLTELPSSVGQKQLDSVEVLDISNNKFSDFRFLEKLPCLHTLILDSNGIRSHTKFHPVENLHTLWLNKNKVDNLTIFVETLVKNFPKLQFLSMMNNPAAPSYFNGGTYQQFLDYRFLEKLPCLHTLILDSNGIRSHTKFHPVENLHTLWLNKNKVDNLTIFVETLVKNFPKLQFLSMMNNPAAPNYFNGGTYQQFLDYRFLEKLPCLHTLILDSNGIRSHTKFHPVENLHTLWLNKNKVDNLTIFVETLVKNFPKLQFLSMMNNPAAPSYFNGGTYQQFLDYRQYVISQIPGLEVLDDKKVTPEERYEAERVYQKLRTTTVTKKKKRRSKSRKEIQVPMRPSDSGDNSS